MEGLKILILEDEIHIGMHLKSMLSRKGYNVVGIAYDGAECLKFAKTENPDVLIADIYLGEGPNGLEIAEKLYLEYGVATIFITADAETEYARIAKKKLNAVSFLEKPIKDQDMVNSVESAIIELEKRQEEDELQNDIKQLGDRIFLKKDLAYHQVMLKDILWLEADGAYCTIHTKENQYMYSINLTRLYNRIGYKELLRVHNKYIINPYNVDKIETGKLHIGGKLISVGKKYSSKVKEQFKTI